MTNKEFKQFVEDIINNLKNTLVIKGNEYSKADGDRLQNFKDAASFLGVTPEVALLGFVTKHIIALKDFIFEIEDGKLKSLLQWQEKCGDIRVYTILLEALISERLNNAD